MQIKHHNVELDLAMILVMVDTEMRKGGTQAYNYCNIGMIIMTM